MNDKYKKELLKQGYEEPTEAEIKELQDVPSSTVLFEDSIKDDTQLRTIPTDGNRKEELEAALKKRKESWGEGFNGGPGAINVNGRPKVPQLSKLTNRQIREKELLNLCRKFKPHLTKAVKTFTDILENPDSSETNKLKAAVFITQFYKEIIKDTFDYRYDNDQGKDVQEDNKPVFSLKMIEPEK